MCRFLILVVCCFPLSQCLYSSISRGSWPSSIPNSFSCNGTGEAVVSFHILEEPPLEWIPLGKQYGFDDIVFWHKKDEGLRFEDVADQIEVVVTGPHASAAFPEELRPFISDTLSRRKQHDYSDIMTGPTGRAWAALDSRVIFVQNPHARVVLDPNREPAQDPQATLQEFFVQLRRQRAGERNVGFKGIDSIRPVTFSGEDVLVEPTESEWPSLMSALNASATLGPLAYEAALQRVMKTLISTRPRRALSFIGLHDTSNHKMRQDGGINVERPEADRLPSLVNFGNLGDVSGDALSPTEHISTRGGDGVELRQIATSWAEAFGVPSSQNFSKPAAHAFLEPFSFNRPYAGGFELKKWSAWLRAAGANFSAFQVEFERSVLLGPSAAAALSVRGLDWPEIDEEHIAGIARQLKGALSRWLAR